MAQTGFHDLLFHKGRYTAVVFGDDKTKDADVRLIAGLIANGIHEETKPPDLLRWLPEAGYEPQTAKFFHGKTALDTVKFLREDLFNMKTRPDVVAATYKNPAGKLMVIRYASATVAKQVLQTAQKSRDTQGMVFVQEGNLLGVAWAMKGKTLDPALVNRLTFTLHKPGVTRFYL